VREGSFILGSSLEYFPAGTVFLCVVDPGVGGDRRNLIVETDRHFFVGPDNGILSCVFEKGLARKVYAVKPGKHTLPLHGRTFLGRDVFAPIAAHLAMGAVPREMGEPVDSVLIVPALKPFVNRKGEVSGRAVYVDTFGNIITNISESYLIGHYGKGIDWDEVTIHTGKRRIRGVKRYYEQGGPGKLMALFDSWGYLELAVNMGSAFGLLGLTEKKSLEVFVSGPEAAGGK